MPPRSTQLAAVAVSLVAIAAVALLAGETLLAGFCLLLTSLVIYLRETRA